MDDMGTIECKTPSNRGDNILVSATAFDVTKVRMEINLKIMIIVVLAFTKKIMIIGQGEEAPEIGATGPVTGVAYKECNWKVPYKVGVICCCWLLFSLDHLEKIMT